MQVNNLTVQGGISLLSATGGTKIHTSFSSKETCNGSFAPASIAGTETFTVNDIISTLRYSNGGSISIYHGSSETISSVAIPAGWFCCMWIPDTGYKPDNHTYGTLMMTGMTIDGFYIVRYADGSIASVHKWY